MTVSRKLCNSCGLTLPVTQFHNQSDKKDGKKSRCKLCTNKVNLERYHSCEKTKRSSNAASRKHSLFKNYGLTPEDYDLMLSKQKGKCAICSSDKPWGFVHKPKRARKFFCVDHCHTTRNVRGLLCHPCNTGLGSFRDNPDSMRSAIKYLEGE
jgi:hypothetical protein